MGPVGVNLSKMHQVVTIEPNKRPAAEILSCETGSVRFGPTKGLNNLCELLCAFSL
jgi:hypothetical protein